LVRRRARGKGRGLGHSGLRQKGPDVLSDQLRRGETQRATRRDKSEAALDVDLPGEIAGRFHQVFVALTGFDQCAAQAPFQGDVAPQKQGRRAFGPGKEHQIQRLAGVLRRAFTVEKQWRDLGGPAGQRGVQGVAQLCGQPALQQPGDRIGARIGAQDDAVAGDHQDRTREVLEGPSGRKQGKVGSVPGQTRLGLVCESGVAGPGHRAARAGIARSLGFGQFASSSLRPA
jgi:hypothetical protein